MTRTVQLEPKQPTPQAVQPTEITATVLRLHLQGTPTEAIAAYLGLDVSVTERYLEHAFASLASHFTSADSLRLFLRYAAVQLNLISDLDEVIKAWKDNDRDPRGASAVVNAIKLKSDLYDKIYDKGRETHNLKLKTDDSAGDVLRSSPDRIKQTLQQYILQINNILQSETNNNTVNVMPERRVVMRQIAGDTPNFVSNRWISGLSVDVKQWALEYAKLSLVKKSKQDSKKLLTGDVG